MNFNTTTLTIGSLLEGLQEASDPETMQAWGGKLIIPRTKKRSDIATKGAWQTGHFCSSTLYFLRRPDGVFTLINDAEGRLHGTLEYAGSRYSVDGKLFRALSEESKQTFLSAKVQACLINCPQDELEDLARWIRNSAGVPFSKAARTHAESVLAAV